MRKGKPTRQMWWGVEAQCSRCFGFWPVEPEFFPVIVDGKARGACRACRLESDSRRHGSNTKTVSTGLST